MDVLDGSRRLGAVHCGCGLAGHTRPAGAVRTALSDRRPPDRDEGGLLPQHESEGLQRAPELPMKARRDRRRRMREYIAS